MLGLPISDEPSKHRKHASVTSVLSYHLVERMFHKGSEKSKGRIRPKRRVFWCVPSLTLLTVEGGGVWCIGNGFTMHCPYTYAESKKYIYKLKQPFLLVCAAASDFFRGCRELSVEGGCSVRISGYFHVAPPPREECVSSFHLNFLFFLLLPITLSLHVPCP